MTNMNLQLYNPKTKQRTKLLLVFIFYLLIISHFTDAKAQNKPEIKLVLQITIDGLRGDLLSRYADRFGQSGFNYLIKNGTVYTNAHYQHANTETIVGHATLATGAQPSVHGMTGNVWFAAEDGEREDPPSGAAQALRGSDRSRARPAVAPGSSSSPRTC